jgi:Phage head-tail joining protein
MGIARYENATINAVTNGTDDFGQYTTTITPLFTSRAIVKDVRNSLRIAEKYRAYQDLVNLTFNYTPNMKAVVDDQFNYSVTWRDQEWRITDIFESDDRMRITLLCYFANPSVPV